MSQKIQKLLAFCAEANSNFSTLEFNKWSKKGIIFRIKIAYNTLRLTHTSIGRESYLMRKLSSYLVISVNRKGRGFLIDRSAKG
jgi:hypothetical protein